VPSNQNASGWLKVVVLLAILASGLIASRYISREQLTGLIRRASQVGWPGYLLFIGAYALWAVLGLPCSLLSLGAAIAFGFWRALGLVLCGAAIGAAIGFLIARHFARDWFTQKVGERFALAQINRAVGESGWKIVMLTRLPPVSPFGLVNYAYGLTPVSFRDFMIGTVIGMIPGTAAYIYLGTIVGNVAQGTERQRTPLEWTFYIGGFLATIVVCIYLIRLAKAALARHAIAK
jgi:uncharacterized membrane protein YdjX (TVP38/TMEM64 family)